MSEARRITNALKGRWVGTSGLARCPAHNDKTPSLSLSDGPEGRLLAYCHAGCDFKAIVEALGDLKPQSLRPEAWADEKHAQRHEAEIERKSAKAKQLWQNALPLKGTLAEVYLRKARGITCPLSDQLRFHPEAWHGATANSYPAMLARVEGCSAFAIHRTYLAPDGCGKANIIPSKAMLGATSGGAVRLSSGTEALAVAEGIESALSLLCGPLQGPISVWAALSASGMAKLALPPQPSRLIIASDGDRTGQQAAQRLAIRAASQGWNVTLFPAPEGRDWNDIIQQMKEAVE